MSLDVRVSNVNMLRQALSIVALGKDPWATMIFVPQYATFHHASADQNLVASATLPGSIFTEAANFEGTVSFMTGVLPLLDALSVCDSAASPYTKVRLRFPNEHGRLVVTIHEGDHIAESVLLTRPSKDHILNHRFDDFSQVNSVVLRGDCARDIMGDIVAYSVDKVALLFDGNDKGMSFHGLGSHIGAMAVEVPRGSDAVIRMDVNDKTMRPKYLISHLTQAFGLHQVAGVGIGQIGGVGRPRGGGGGYGGGGTQWGQNGTTMMMGGPQAGAPGGGGAVFDASQTSIQLTTNAEQQLKVTHTIQDGDLRLTGKITILPLSNMLDE